DRLDRDVVTLLGGRTFGVQGGCHVEQVEGHAGAATVLGGGVADLAGAGDQARHAPLGVLALCGVVDRGVVVVEPCLRVAAVADASTPQRHALDDVLVAAEPVVALVGGGGVGGGLLHGLRGWLVAPPVAGEGGGGADARREVACAVHADGEGG